MRKRTIFIELTSLLDVILIMIFVLLTQARAQTTEAVEDAAADRAALQEVRQEMQAAQAEADRIRNHLEAENEALLQKTEALEAEVDALGRRMISENLVLDNSLVLSLSVAADASVSLDVREGESIRIPYDWNDSTYAYNRLRSLLYEQLNQAAGRTVFLVFQYDRASIYHAEYEMILQVIQETKLEASQREILLSVIEMDVKE